MEKDTPHSFFLDTKIALSQNFCTYFRQLLTQCICSDERRRHSYFQIALRVQTFHNIATFQHRLLVFQFQRIFIFICQSSNNWQHNKQLLFLFLLFSLAFLHLVVAANLFFPISQNKLGSLLCMQYYSSELSNQRANI